jgi:hypothetical protein
MVGYVEMKGPTTVVAENDQYKQDLETHCWDCEEIEQVDQMNSDLEEIRQEGHRERGPESLMAAGFPERVGVNCSESSLHDHKRPHWQLE